MKKIYVNCLLALAVGFGTACENTRQSTETTTTTDVADTDSDENITTEPADGTAVGATEDTSQITTGKPPVPAYTSDADFVVMAASGGLMEVEAGKAATQKGSTTEVKNFGQQMVTDHTKANTELKSLAGKKNWTVPTKMNPEHQTAFDRLNKMTGKEFDRDYAAQMVMDHEKTVAMFEQATQQATDPDLKAFASKNLPTLRHHLDMARTLNDKMKNM